MRTPSPWCAARARRGAVAALALVVGCGPRAELCEREFALAPEGWVQLAPDEDPYWPDDATGLTPCGSADVKVEDFGIEPSFTVETSFCNWATVTQPVPVLLGPGDRVHLRIWYETQLDFAGAVARLAVRFSDEELFVREIPIPSESGLISEDLFIEGAIPEGAPAYFHVGNHGANSWNLLELSLYPRTPCRDAGPAD